MQLLCFLKLNERLRPMPAYLLYFYLALISNKCIRLIDNAFGGFEAQSPKEASKAQNPLCNQPHAES
jgi:hypothetical protein